MMVQKLWLAQYVLRNLRQHKAAYSSYVHKFFSDESAPYLSQKRIYSKMMGFIIGIEAWQKAFLGESASGERLFFFSVLMLAYDNLIDEAEFRAWSDLEALIKDECPSFPLNSKEAQVFYEALRAFRAALPDVWKDNLQSFLMIHRATQVCFETSDSDELKTASFEKGGNCYSIIVSLVGCKHGYSEQRLMDFGAAMQMADDIFDRKEDDELGLNTPAAQRSLSEEDREYLRRAFSDTVLPKTLEQRYLHQAFCGYLEGAFSYYDSPGLAGRWRHSFGLSLMDLAARWL